MRITLYNTISQGSGIQVIFVEDQQRIEISILSDSYIPDDEFERIIELILTKDSAQNYYLFCPYNHKAAQRILTAIDPLIIKAVVVSNESFPISDVMRIQWFPNSNIIQSYLWAIELLTNTIVAERTIDNELTDDQVDSNIQDEELSLVEEPLLNSDELSKYLQLRKADTKDPYDFN